MSTIVFYISGHGFGHASRQVEIINALGDGLGGHTAIVIRSSVSASLLSRTLRVPYDLRPGDCDTGVVQSNSITHDDARTIVAADAFYRDWPARVDAEIARLSGLDVDVIVGDIPPLAFEVAARLGVPSIAVGNFTWSWIYEAYPELVERAPHVIETIRAAYAKATIALRLPFAGDFSVFPVVRDIPLVARRARHSPIETRRHFGLPADTPLALISFGGYGLPSLDLAALDCVTDWGVVVTDRSAASGAGANLPDGIYPIAEERLAGEFRYEDLVAAVDVVVTKPGYGIIGECVANDTAMLYTSRGAFREYDMLVTEMPSYLRCQFISQPDLFAGRWSRPLEAIRALPAPPLSLEPTGAEAAAEIIAATAASAEHSENKLEVRSQK